MTPITGEQIRQSMMSQGIERVDHHDCGICGYMTAYIRVGDVLYFDPGCYCASGAGWEQRTFQEAADWINMQTQPRWRASIAARFGLTSSAQAQP